MEAPAPRTTTTTIERPTRASIRDEARPAAGAISQEVDLLRAQVQRLRSELTALTHSPSTSSRPRFERPRLQRYHTGAYTQLPRPLRQQVSEARNRGRRGVIRI